MSTSVIEPGYYYVRAMYYPLWHVGEHTATNVEADTDMGDLTIEEFRQYFPAAKRIDQDKVDEILAKLREVREAEHLTSSTGLSAKD